MIDQSLQLALLRALYLFHFAPERGQDSFDWRTWAEALGTGEEVAFASYGDLEDKGLVRASSCGGFAEITSPGIIFVEENGVAPDDLLRYHAEVRFAMVGAYARLYEREGSRGYRDWEEIIRDAALNETDFALNLQLLFDLGVLEPCATEGLRNYQISGAGRLWFEEARGRRARVARLNALYSGSEVTPAARGHELEKLLQDQVVAEGWDAERNVRGPGEEHDLVISQGRDFFFVECRWRKEKAEAGDLSKLRDRVTARAGAMGLFVSMSGFTSGAIRDAEDRLERCVMLLFGPKEVRAVMGGEATFTDLLILMRFQVETNDPGPCGQAS
jgi:hypothetical protein